MSDALALEPLPASDEGLAAIGMMSELAQVLGVARCATSHPLRPRAEELPDPWDSSLRSFRQLLRRLVRYAGEDDHRVPIVVRNEETPGASRLGDEMSSHVWCEGWTGEALVFGVGSLGDGRATLGPACLELARGLLHRARIEVAPRRYRLSPSDGPKIELPTTREAYLAAILLGWGVPVANACFDPRSVGAVLGNTTATAWVSSAIAESPEVAAWALAALARVCDRDEAFVDRIREDLYPTQRRAFDTAYEGLGGHEEDLRRTMHWPRGPVEFDRPDPLAPIEGDDHDDELDVADEQKALAVRHPNAGLPVFIYRRRMTFPLTVVGLLAGALVSVLVGHWLPVVVLALIGWFAGRRLRQSNCSDPNCDAPLPDDAKICPRCHGVVSGEISHPKERLAAEEALEAAARLEAAEL